MGKTEFSSTVKNRTNSASYVRKTRKDITDADDEKEIPDVSRNKLIPTSMNVFFFFFFLKLKGAFISTKKWLASQQRYQLCKTNMLSCFQRLFSLLLFSCVLGRSSVLQW